MPKVNSPNDDEAVPEAKRLMLLDLAEAVVKTWERSGYPWQDLVDGFGGGDGTGLPPEDTFRDLALDVVQRRLKHEPEAELRRLMRSRVYRGHYDVDQHSDFIGGEQSISRDELIGLAVWRYLAFQMERQYVEPEGDVEKDEDEEDEEETEPEQLTLLL